MRATPPHRRVFMQQRLTEQAGSPSEERCHNVAKTGVDSGGLKTQDESYFALGMLEIG